jgi:hypothetical protein
MKNMQTLVDTLLANSIQTIIPLTEEYALEHDIDGYCSIFEKQWIMTNHNYSLIYTDDDGYICDANIISKVDATTWHIELFDGREIEIENGSYCSSCDLSLFKKSSFNLNEENPAESNFTSADGVMYPTILKRISKNS